MENGTRSNSDEWETAQFLLAVSFFREGPLVDSLTIAPSGYGIGGEIKFVTDRNTGATMIIVKPDSNFPGCWIRNEDIIKILEFLTPPPPEPPPEPPPRT